jgi:hydroxypyruvate isomerase
MNFKYSANVGFLWDYLELPERVLAAHKAGFDAVEFHFPYDYPADSIRNVLDKTNLSVVGINTKLGDGKNEFGVASLHGRQQDAQNYIDQAIEYAVVIGAQNINVVAGLTNQDPAAQAIYIENLQYACDAAVKADKNIVIEPLNPRSVPHYHFSTVEQAMSIINGVNRDNIKMMFDVFHAQIVEGDIATLLQTYVNQIGHVQISAVHDRGEPDAGEINYKFILETLDTVGYTGYIGAEYKPRGKTVESGLSWLDSFRNTNLN